jgi:diketogulonate reductase-like aldo/keto reductase
MLTKREEQAIKNLEKALARCKKHNIDLYAYDGLHWCIVDPTPDFCESYEALRRNGLAGDIEDRGCFMDQGGF